MLDPNDPLKTSIDQPPPVPNASRPTWELVIEELERTAAEYTRRGLVPMAAAAVRAIDLARERDAVGRARYGTPLQPDNGRDHLLDALAEAADQAVYLRNEVAKVEGREDPYATGVRTAYAGAYHGFLGLVGLMALREKVEAARG